MARFPQPFPFVRMRERGKAREPDYIVFTDPLTVEQFEKMTVFFVVLGMLMFAGTLGK